MAGLPQLTTGALERILREEEVEKPVLQVLQLDKMTKGETKRFKALISDGVTSTQAILATQLTDLVLDGQLRENAIICVDDKVVSNVGGKVVIIVIGVSVLGKANAVIGNPQVAGAGSNNASNNTNNSHGAVNPPPAMRANANQPPQSLRPQQSGQTRQYAQPGQQQQQNPVNQTQQGGYRQNGPVVQQREMNTGAGNERILPIRALNMYQSRWVIKGRVINKSDIRRWDKGPNKQGQLFSMEIMDSEGTEIRATFFREAVDRFFDMIEPNGVYTLSGGRVKLANKSFNNTRNEYELTFDQNANITRVQDDGNIAEVHLEATSIANIADTAANATVDILGIAMDVGEVQEFTSKAGRALTKCEVVMADDSQATIRVTLWGDKAKDTALKLQSSENPVVGIKNCKVSDWGGRTLSTGASSQIVIEPELPRTQQLRQWFANGGANNLQALSGSAGAGGAGARGGVKPISERYSLQGIKDMQLGKSEKPDYVDVKATIQHIPHEKMWYEACPEEGNNKKVTRQADGTWFCEPTAQTYTTKENRYILRTVLADYTGSVYATSFNEGAQIIMGNKTADELENLKNQSESEFESFVNDCVFQQYNFRLRVKEETYNETTRQKCSVMSVSPVDYVQESKLLIDAIENFQ